MGVNGESAIANKPSNIAVFMHLHYRLITRRSLVQVLLPQPNKKPPKTAEMRGFRGFLMSCFDRSFSVKTGQKRCKSLKNGSQKGSQRIRELCCCNIRIQIFFKYFYQIECDSCYSFLKQPPLRTMFTCHHLLLFLSVVF